MILGFDLTESIVIGMFIHLTVNWGIECLCFSLHCSLLACEKVYNLVRFGFILEILMVGQNLL